MLPKQVLFFALLLASAQAFPLVVSHPTFPWSAAPFPFGSFSNALDHLELLLPSARMSPRSLATPSVRMSDDGSLANLAVSLPGGFQPDDLHVTVEGRQLHVKGESKTESSSHYFSRSVTLPFAIDDTTDITASLDTADSSLVLSLPRPAASKQAAPTQIPVTSSIAQQSLPPGAADQASLSQEQASARAQQHWRTVSHAVRAMEAFKDAAGSAKPAQHTASATAALDASVPSTEATAQKQDVAQSVRATNSTPQAAKKENLTLKRVPEGHEHAEHEPSSTGTLSAPALSKQTDTADSLAGLTEEQALELLRQKFGSHFAQQ